MFLHVISDLLLLMFIFGNLKQHIISVTYASQIVESGNRMKTCKESWLQNGLYLVNVKNVAVVKQM